MPRSPQGHPVIIQAGASDRGRSFAARETECPVTVDVCDRLLRLPFHNDLSEGEIRVGDTTLHEGDVIAIDGTKGVITTDEVELVDPEINENFETVLAWSDDLRRLGGSIDQRIGPYRDLEPQQFQLLRRWDPYGMPGDEDVSDPRERDMSAYVEMYDVMERSIPPLVEHLMWLVEDIAREQAP